MAKYEMSFGKTIQNEQGWAKDKDDHGGETWDGIARNYWPNWIGWDIIDHYKLLPGFPENLRGSSELKKAKFQFYLENYWNPIRGSEINFQPTADRLFDEAVNAGVGKAIAEVRESEGFPAGTKMDDAFLNFLNHKS